MKLLRSYFYQTVVFVVALLTMHSCSCSSKTLESKLEKIDNTADVVVVLNLETLLEQTDFTVKDDHLEFPGYINKLMSAFLDSSDKRVLSKITEFKGIDYTQVVVAGYDLEDYEDRFVMAMFNVTDEDDFIKSVKDLNDKAWSGDRDGYTALTLGDHGPKMLMKDDMVYLVKDDVTVKDLEKRFEKAKEKPLEDWKVKYLSDENKEMAALISGKLLDNADKELRTALTYGLDVDLMTASLGVSVNLEGPKASITYSALDKDGNGVPYKLVKPIDTEVINYVNPNDLVVCAFGVNSLSMMKTALQQMGEYTYMNDKMKALVDKVSGFKNLTGMISAGPRTDSQFDKGFEPAEELRITMAVSGDSKDMQMVYNYVCDYINYLKSEGTRSEPVFGQSAGGYPTEISIDIPMDRRYDYERDVYIPGDIIKVTVAKKGNVVVLSNGPITGKGSPNFPASEFSGKGGMVKVVVPKDLPNLPVKLPNGVIASMETGETAEVTATVAITGTDEKFVPAVANMVLNFGR